LGNVRNVCGQLHVPADLSVPCGRHTKGVDGECRGLNVFHIVKGNLDDTDLSGVDFAFLNWFPTHLTAGGWKVGAVVDEGASDPQVSALETILRGQAGGPFGDLAGLDFDGVYGETFYFVFVSEMAAGAPKGRG